MDTNELINDEDLDVEMGPAGGTKSGGGSASKQQATELLINMDGLSARERNRLKRKAKSLGRTDSLQSAHSLGRAMSTPTTRVPATQGGVVKSEGEPSGSAQQGGSARRGTPPVENSGGEPSAAEGDEVEWASVLAGAWPFQSLCDQLCVDVLDPCWEVRHGAAAALREVLKCQAGCAGVEAPMADETSGWAMNGGSGV